jgi:hypothetical protein
MGVEPREESANAAGSQCHARVSRSVIEINGVFVFTNRLSAWEHDIADIPASLVWGFRPEYPRVSTLQANIWLVEIE